MEQSIITLFQQYIEYAVIISLLLNIIIAISGIVPSYFLTGANLLFFGFWGGFFISFVGEALGAIISFVLYRIGIKSLSVQSLKKYPKLQQVIEMEGKKAFLTIFSLRLLPFIPSGFITMAAAIGKVSLIVFSISSSLGKLPALFIESYSAYHILSFTWEGKIILILIAFILIYWVYHSSF